jgi:hypothetical protein
VGEQQQLSPVTLSDFPQIQTTAAVEVQRATGVET